MSEVAARTRCRALVAGFGRPGMRDLDFGRQLIRYLEALDWPEGVVVEDLSYAAPLVLHRLQELEPAKVVLVGAAARDFDPPGALRRYRLDLGAPGPEEVHKSLEESVQGLVDIDHTLAVVRHWGALPSETVVIEVEPADCSFGPGYSDELDAAFDPMLAMVREELDAPLPSPADSFFSSLLNAAPDPTATTPSDPPDPSETDATGPSEGLTELSRYANQHAHLRTVQRHRQAPLIDGSLGIEGLEVAGRSRPWGVKIENGSDWFDVIPLQDGWVGVVMGDVPGRGVEAAGVMADLRAGVRAYSVLVGHSPASMVHHLDRLVHSTGLGEGATLVYLALQPKTGELHLSNAEHCLPLLLAGGHDSRFLRDGLSGRLGADPQAERPEARLLLAPGSTVVLFTDGLVQSRRRPIRDGLEKLRNAAAHASGSVEDLCDRILELCTSGLQRDDDISLLALRLTGQDL
jgi:hydrogenase maturation protease